MPYPIFPSTTWPALDVQDRSPSIAIPTVPTLLIPPTIVVSAGISYDPLAGIIVLPETRDYTVFVMVNCSTSASRSLYAYVEVDIGSGFVASQYSGRRVSINGSTDGQVITVSRNLFQAGTKLRFYLWASGSITANTTDLAGLPANTATAPAYRMLVAG